MQIASDSQKRSLAKSPYTYPYSVGADNDFDLGEITDLARRFREAHVRLNNIELKLHETVFGTTERIRLLRTLEVARMDYSDARFALSTRTLVSSKR